MTLNERKTVLRGVMTLGKKAYKDLTLSQKEAEGLIKLIDDEGLFTSKDRKVQNFIKHLENIINAKKDDKKEDNTKLEQTILDIIEPKEELKNDTKEESQSEPKEEIKPVEKSEPKEEKKVANKKPLSAKEKKAIKLQEYKEEFYKELGDLEERKQINKFIRTEITNDDIDRYFTVSPLKIDKIGLQLLNNKAVFFLDTEYGMERVTIIDKDYKDNRLYLLIKSLDTKNFDRVYLDTYDSKRGVFVHHIDDDTIYDMTFYIPVLKKGVTIE